MKHRHVILDRAGVLNSEAAGAGYVREPSEFHWLPGALEGLAMLRHAGLYLSVATNPSGGRRGLMSLAQLQAVHEHMRTQAAGQGAALDAVFVCPHAPQEQCGCRKPAPGPIQAATHPAGMASPSAL